MAAADMKPLLTLVSLLAMCKSEPCDADTYEPCVMMAKPILTQPNLVFPDTERDIDVMCKTWKRFEDCINNYTNHCFSENQQEEFKKAVETPVVNVHRMCTEQQYQQEYLHYAPCIQSTVTREGYCASHYRSLLDQVMGENKQSKLCCYHNHFRKCVLTLTRDRCNYGSDPDSAVMFSQQILDKALSFLYAQCVNYTLDPEECMPPPTYAKMDNTVRINDYSTASDFFQQQSTDEITQSRWPSTSGSSATPYSQGRSPSSYQSPPWTSVGIFSTSSPYQPSPTFSSEASTSSQQATILSREVAGRTWRVSSLDLTTPQAWYPASPDNPYQMSLEHSNQDQDQGLGSSGVTFAVSLQLFVTGLFAVL